MTRVVFMGTPEFSVPSLAMLVASDYDVVGVVTQPDRPAAAAASWNRRRSSGLQSSTASSCCSRKPCARPRRSPHSPRCDLTSSSSLRLGRSCGRPY